MQCETPTVVTAAEHWKFTSARAVRTCAAALARARRTMPTFWRPRGSSSVPAAAAVAVVAHHRIRFHLKSTAPEIEVRSGSFVQVQFPRCCTADFVLVGL